MSQPARTFWHSGLTIALAEISILVQYPKIQLYLVYERVLPKFVNSAPFIISLIFLNGVENPTFSCCFSKTHRSRALNHQIVIANWISGVVIGDSFISFNWHFPNFQNFFLNEILIQIFKNVFPSSQPPLTSHQWTS